MNGKTPVILSIKPRYAELIFSELKRAELRRRILTSIEDRAVFVYVSSPLKQLRGGFRVDELLSGTPRQIWKQVSGVSAIEKEDFDAYYRSSLKAYALRIGEVWEYRRPVGLDALRERIPGFVAPQSWRYVKPRECEFFKSLKKISAEKRKKLAA